MKQLKKMTKKIMVKGVHAAGIILMVIQSFWAPITYGIYSIPAARAEDQAVVESSPPADSTSDKTDSAPAPSDSTTAPKETTATDTKDTSASTDPAPATETAAPADNSAATDSPTPNDPTTTSDVTVPDATDTTNTTATTSTTDSTALPTVTDNSAADTSNSSQNSLNQSSNVTATDLSGQICLGANDQIKDSSDSDWNYDETKGSAETKDNAKLGVKYIFPGNSDVSVTFSCLPKDPSKITTLKIQQIDTADINLPAGVSAAGDWAYDITTGMKDGDFKYDLTLPKTDVENADVNYIEKTASEVKSQDLTTADLKSVSDKNVKTGDKDVKVTDLDHFTVFVQTLKTVSNTNFGSTTVTGTCMTTDYDGGGLTCTANDTSLSSTSEPVIIGDGATFNDASNSTNGKGCQYPGDFVKFSTDWQIATNATQRYNFGLWFASAGQTNVTDGGQCSITSLPSSPSPFFESLDHQGNFHDSCGDMNSGAAGNLAVTMVAKCIPDSNGLLKLPYCTSWSQNDNNSCTKPEQTLPGTGSKCNCNGGFTIPIYIPPAIEVIKNLSPTNDTGKFDLVVNTVTEKTDAGNNDTTGSVGINLGSNTFGEANGTGTDLNNYASSASCVNRGTQTSVSASQNGNTWTIANVTNGQDIVCTITNTRNAGSIELKKDWVGIAGNTTLKIGITAGASDIASQPANGADATTGAKTVSTGTYYVSEDTSALGNYNSSLACTDDGSPVTPGTDNSLSVATGHAVVCTFTNTLQTGSIKIVKNTLGGDGKFDFTSNFGVTSLTTSGKTASQTINNLIQGSDYNISETVPDGWSLDSATCDKGSIDAIAVDAGQTTTCTFTNSKNPALTVVKNVVNDNGGTKTVGDFGITFSGGTLNFDSGVGAGTTKTYTSQTLTLNVGNYTLSENDIDGYTEGTWDCGTPDSTGISTSITLAAGDNKTCTITNDDIAGTLTLEKNLNQNYGGTESATNWTLSASGPTSISGASGSANVTNAAVSAGTYTLSESGPAGYSPSDWSCTGGAQDGSNITIGNGESATCAITNSDMPAKLKVCKFNDVNGNGVKDTDEEMLSGWTMTLNPGNISQITGEDGCAQFSDLAKGNYTVTETLQDDWRTITGLSQNISLTLADDETIYFGNQQLGKIIVHKDVVDPSGNPVTDTTNNFKVTLNDSNEQNITDGGIVTYNGLITGNYTVKENFIPDGYELTSITPDSNSSSDGAQVSVAPGGTTNVYVVNKQKPASLTVTKNINADLGNVHPDDFNLNVNSAKVFSGAKNTYPAHTNLIVNEGNLDGYSLKDIVCTSNVSGSANIISSNLLPATINLVPGENVSCTITNDDNLGKIIIEKQTLPDGDATEFPFSGTGINAGTKLQDGESAEKIVAPGNYSVSESVPSGWDLTDISCDDSDSSGNPATAPTANINVSDNETVKCAFTNTKRGSITITKDAVPNNAQDFTFNDNFGNGNPANFLLDDDSNATLPRTRTFEVLPGNYKVSENATAGWKLSSVSCSNGSDISNISVSPGENVTCTFTNKQLGSITIVKNTIGSDGIFDYAMTGNTLPSSAQITTSGNTGSQTFTDIDPENTYSISENNQTGWDPTSVICENNYGTQKDPAGFQIPNGGNVTCTFTNTAQGHITVEKDVNCMYSGCVDQDINFFIWQGGNILQPFQINSQDPPYDSGFLPAGSYQVTEDMPPGWYPVSASCSNGVDTNINPNNITLDPGETIACVFTNNKMGKIQISKSTDPAGSPEEFDFSSSFMGDFSLKGGENLTSDWLMPGSDYSVSEASKTGWDNVGFACGDGNTDSSHITVRNNETTQCNFVNVQRGHLIVQKTTFPANDPTQFSISASGNGTITGSPDGTITDSSDWDYEVTPGTYSIAETLPTGWDKTDDTCQNVEVDAGETEYCTITNTKQATIQVLKNVDLNNDGNYTDPNETNVIDWNWNINGNVNYATGSSAQSIIPNQTYAISEVHQNDFHVVDLSCDINGNVTDFGAVESQDIAINPGDTIACTFNNARDYGTVIVDKVTDPTGASDIFTINLSQSGNPVHIYSIADQDPAESFAVPSGTYSLAEDLANNAGWKLSGATCVVNSGQNGSFDPQAGAFAVNNGDNILCTFNNQFIVPGLRIDKSNDANGPKSPGGSVTYTIVIKAKGIASDGETLTTNTSNVNDVKVTDVPPSGFSYRSGSWTAHSSVRGDIKNSPTTEPTYHSPGVWQLGTMIPDEEVTLTYIADISTAQDAGNYPDLAWAAGTDLLGATVQATQGDPSFFAGTQVAVIVPEQNSVALVETSRTDTDTKHKTKRVLGEAIVLPATGTNSFWIVMILALLSAGLYLIKRGRNNKSKEMIMKIFAIALATSSFLFFGGQAQAAPIIADDHLSIQIETPDSPQLTTDFQIGFVALDIDNKPVEVKCFRDGVAVPFETFSSAASGNCNIANSGITSSGNYKFYVTADAGSGTNQTDPVSVDIDLAVPSTPLNYSRNNCVVSFLTANDGLTTKVELYRSTTLDFTADSSTFVDSINIGPNNSGTITDINADCGGNYFYAIRAVSASGAGSDFTGDEKVTVHHRSRTRTRTITTHPTVQAVGAIPVQGGAVAGQATGPEEGNVQGESTEQGQVSEGTGQVAGVENWLTKLKNNWPWILVALAILGIIYYAYKKRKGKSDNLPKIPKGPGNSVE